MMSCGATTTILSLIAWICAKSNGLAFGNAHEIAIKILSMFDDGEYDVATLFLFRVPVGDDADSDGLADYSSQVTASAGDVDETVDLGGAVYDYEPDESEILEELLPRNIGVQSFPGPA